MSTSAQITTAKIIKTAPKTGFYYEIALTGRGSHIYTLYRHGSNGVSTIGVNYDSGYRGNMGATLETATANAVAWLSEFAPNSSLIICEGVSERISRGETLGFGKYKGATLEEVHAEDPRYFNWLANEFKIDSAWTRKCAAWIGEGLKAIIKNLVAAKTARNLEESTSKHVGVLKVRQEMVLVCTGYKVFKDLDYGHESYMFKFEDSKGNAITAYGDKDKYSKGVTYTVKATPVAHGEYLGIKTTRVNRIKEIK